MVDLTDPTGPIREGIDNSIFIIPGVIVATLVGFFVYKLISSLREKERAKNDKKKVKQQRKERDNARKIKKK